MAHMTCQTGTILVLNGPSAVGKSSIQKALQRKSHTHFLRIGIDTFFDALIEEPDLSTFEQDKKFEQYTQLGEYIRGVELQHDENGNTVVPLTIGPAGDRIIHGMHRAIAAYASCGNNVIVDYIQYKTAWGDDLQHVLKDFDVYYVRVHAPIDIIEERERARSTSPIGHARSHYGVVHTGLSYDLELDTSQLTPEECAEKILALIET